jgi:hypothetical protein
MRASRPVLLASAVFVLTAACSRDVTAPAGPTIAGVADKPEPSLTPFYLAGAAPDTAQTDSVIGGYGTNPCGGLDYQDFEYDPETGTEYVVCPDTTGTSGGLEPTPTSPAPKATAPTSGSTTTTDSVTSGYGSGSTGGIDYDQFEYDPETGTGPVVTDTTPKPKTGS